jgi:Fe-S cluster biogenesis protein NfuA
LLGKVFRENKKLNLELESSFSKIASLRSTHDDMSVKPYDRCTMILVNYADLWLIHSHITGLLDSARLELRELKTRSTLLGACTSCPVLISDLETVSIKIKDLTHKLDHSSRYIVLSPPCEGCVSLKGKLLHAIKENTELQQEVAYLTARLEKTILSEKIIEGDLSRVDESVTKSTYRLGVGFERCDDKGEKSAPKFIPSFTYHKEKATIKSTKAHYPSNPKREVRKETPKPREEAFVCMFCGRVDHLDEFFFRWKRIERRHVEYARDPYRDEFIDFLPRSYSLVLPRSYSRASSHTFSRALPHTSSCALPQFAHGPNHRSWFWSMREPL